MTGAGQVADLFLSLAALIGLWVLHSTVAARGRFDPLNRRFLFGLKVTMLLFAGRALYGLSGSGMFRGLVLIAAALVPIAVLLLTEGLLRRHAPPWIKAVIGVGTVVFVAAVALPAAVVEPLRTYSLLVFQIGGLGVAGWLVLRRDRAGLSMQENRTVERLALSLILLIPLGAADFLMLQLGLPVQIAALGVLVLCWLAISLGREEAGHRGALAGILTVTAAAAIATVVVARIAGLAGDPAILVGVVILAATLLAVIVNDAHALRAEERSLSLLHLLAGGGATDAAAFLRGLQAHPMVEGAVLVSAADLPELDAAVLTRIFTAQPVLRRSGPPFAATEEAEHVAHLFERFGASHVLSVSTAPLRLVALSIPAIAVSPRAELELQAVQRMARLMGEGTGDGA